jgi:DNA-binding transcriptional MocR family regulator
VIGVSDRARYQQLADVLRREIEDGTYAPGSRLPPENALRRRHDVGGMTVKRTLAVLREARRGRCGCRATLGLGQSSSAILLKVRPSRFTTHGNHLGLIEPEYESVE